jgi:hypothetical protein
MHAKLEWPSYGPGVEPVSALAVKHVIMHAAEVTLCGTSALRASG